MARPPMQATQRQVETMLEDIRIAFRRQRTEMRTRHSAAEEALAKRYAEEMIRRAAQYGYTVQAVAGANASHGNHHAYGVTFRNVRPR